MSPEEKMLDALLSNVGTEQGVGEPIDECRITMNGSLLQVTHNKEIPTDLADLVAKNRNRIMKELEELLPLCANFGILPMKKGSTIKKCSTLTLQVNASHNSLDEIEDLAEMAENAHFFILQSLQRDIILKNIDADMKPFKDEK